MKITITAPDGKQILTSKGNASLALRSYIRDNCPEADADIRAAREQIRQHKAAISAIRQRIATAYGYTMPGF